MNDSEFFSTGFPCRDVPGAAVRSSLENRGRDSAAGGGPGAAIPGALPDRGAPALPCALCGPWVPVPAGSQAESGRRRGRADGRERALSRRALPAEPAPPGLGCPGGAGRAGHHVERASCSLMCQPPTARPAWRRGSCPLRSPARPRSSRPS